MKIQFRCRSILLAALAISLLAIAGFPQTAWAGSANANSARAEQASDRRAGNGQDDANGGQGKATPAEVAADNDGKVRGSERNDRGNGGTSPENGDGPTTHDGQNGPGGQTCDGDPDTPRDPNNQYHNTCATSDQENSAANGNGGGNATGKPCAGCVGNADDKNPNGQYPNGSDHNNGYECDGNNGIGKGNPAHTGCQPTTPPPDCDPATDPNGCKPCPGKKDLQPDGTCIPKCPNGKPMPASNNVADCDPKCPNGKNMPVSGDVKDCDPKCPAGQVMANGACTTPCVAGDPVCSQSTPTCVAASGNERCGGAAAAAVLGETLGRLDVLGVSIEQPAAVAPSALARTGGFQLSALVQAGIILAMVGLGLTVMGRRRRQTVDIVERIGD